MELPLFPLAAVLFPGGRMSLRVFEQRYLDLVARCGRSGGTFGICLIVDGDEVGGPAVPAAVGTEARIVDFAQTGDGLLAITVEGGRRFRVTSSWAQPDGLVVAAIAWCDEALPEPPRPEHALLAVLLARILDKAGEDHPGVGKGDLGDAARIGWRLAEWLPLDAAARQALLAEDDPHARLQALIERLPDFQAD